MKKSISRYFFLLLVLLVTLAFFQLIGDFFMAVFWATILAILFSGRYEKIKSKMPKQPNLAAGLTLFFLILIVVVPLTIVSIAVVQQASGVANALNQENMDIQSKVADLQDQIAAQDNTLSEFGISTDAIKNKIIEVSSTATKYIANHAVGLTQNILNLFVNFFLALYILFFFLRDGKQLINELIQVIPMKDEDQVELLNRFESVSRATVKGSLVVAFVQGAIGGLAFWALGIHAPFLWGVAMVLASLLPFGAGLIWLPWAVALLLNGDYAKGIVLILIGSLVIGLIDNFLRPRLVGKDTKLPDYLVLLSTLGGLAWFGISGFVIGPVIAALFVTFWQMMGKQYGKPRNQIN